MQQLVAILVNSILPPRCVHCAASTDGLHQLCADCWKEASFISPPFCNKCGKALMSADEVNLPCDCAAMSYDTLRAVFTFDEISRKLVHKFKYSDQTRLSKVLAAWMARIGGPLLGEADALLPVPLHSRRLIERKYNQSSLLAHTLSDISQVPVWPDQLIRTRYTTPQSKLPRKERQENLKGAFALRVPEMVEGKTVILVDDVVTTGSTVNECAHVLKKAGAKKVAVLVVARREDKAHENMAEDTIDEDALW